MNFKKVGPVLCSQHQVVRLRVSLFVLFLFPDKAFNTACTKTSLFWISFLKDI